MSASFKACQSKTQKAGRNNVDGQWDIYSTCNAGMHSCNPPHSWERNSGVDQSVHPSFIQSLSVQGTAGARPCTGSLEVYNDGKNMVLALKEVS